MAEPSRDDAIVQYRQALLGSKKEQASVDARKRQLFFEKPFLSLIPLGFLLSSQWQASRFA